MDLFAGETDVLFLLVEGEGPEELFLPGSEVVLEVEFFEVLDDLLHAQVHVPLGEVGGDVVEARGGLLKVGVEEQDEEVVRADVLGGPVDRVAEDRQLALLQREVGLVKFLLLHEVRDQLFVYVDQPLGVQGMLVEPQGLHRQSVQRLRQLVECLLLGVLH